MTSRRVVTRAVAVSSGALVAGALGMGPAAAAISGGQGSTTDPLGGALSAGSSAVAGVTSTVNGTVSSTGLPKPVQKTVKDVTKTVNSVAGTVDKTVRKLTGQPASGGGSTRKPTPGPQHSHRPQPSGSGTTTGTHHSRHRAAAAHRTRHAAGVRIAPVSGAYGMTAGEAAQIAAAHAPAVAGPQQSAPLVAGRDLAPAAQHHAASLPRTVVHDTALALELQLLAGVLAGIVAAGHGYVQRRRIRTTLVHAARRTSSALTVAAPAAH